MNSRRPTASQAGRAAGQPSPLEQFQMRYREVLNYTGGACASGGRRAVGVECCHPGVSGGINNAAVDESAYASSTVIVGRAAVACAQLMKCVS
ncbi:hypothetical protein EVAR_70001_1 [Eumeta japonica]|uniref:Uncharacterized protein n=1 Tax=Eumeta variegata TaxID=151549 RepID=A0A4C2A0Z0_EUMVA|nr:hypothetical protein EVAR_70001_1 [Eumeta japonica]